MIRSVLALSALFIGMSAAGAQNVNLVGELSENVYESARSSGSPIIGAQIVADSAPDRQTSQFGELDFALYLPKGWDAVCVSTKTANGLYDARGTFSLEGAAESVGVRGAVITAPYPTKYPDRLAELGGQELAMAVRNGACDQLSHGDAIPVNRGVEFALAFWRPGKRSMDLGQSLRVLVNPFDAKRARLSIGGKVFNCRAAEVPVPATYSMVCEVPLTALGPSPSKVQLESLVPGRETQTSYLLLHHPGP